MGKLFALLLLPVMFGACTSSKQPQPPAQGVVSYALGNYKFYSLNNNSGTVDENRFAVGKNPDKSYPGWNDTAINYFLLDTGETKILFDAGLPEHSGGNLLKRLNSAGFDPKDINIICITHMHGDHIGGLLDKEGKKVFANAKLYIPKEEAVYWQSDMQMKKAKSEDSFKNARAVLTVYKDVLTLFNQNAVIVPQVKSLPLFGHTPGHSGFEITAGGKKIVVWGDLLHAAVQFSDPAVCVNYDVDVKTAQKTRESFLQRAAAENFYIVGMHVLPPAAGKVKKEGGGYVLVPGI